MSDYEAHKKELLKKVSKLPAWRQRIFFAQARALGLVTITEKDLCPNLYIVKNQKD